MQPLWSSSTWTHLVSSCLSRAEGKLHFVLGYQRWHNLFYRDNWLHKAGLSCKDTAEKRGRCIGHIYKVNSKGPEAMYLIKKSFNIYVKGVREDGRKCHVHFAFHLWSIRSCTGTKRKMGTQSQQVRVSQQTWCDWMLSTGHLDFYSMELRRAAAACPVLVKYALF
jgi:hypothetical protein